EWFFRPVTAGRLRADEVLDPGPDLRAVALPGREQAQDRPGGLRGGGWPLPCGARAVVAAAALAPPATGVLPFPQPPDRPPDDRCGHLEAHSRQPDQHLPRAVDVVDAPPAEPRPGFFLAGQDELHRPIDRLLADPVAVVAERLQRPGGNVRATR